MTKPDPPQTGNVVKTACQLCALSCGMDVYVEQGRAVRVAGMKEHPLNRGKLCPKGARSLDWVYHPDRLRHPMRRENGGWKQISWDEALDTIAARLTKVKDTYGPRALAGAIGMTILLGGTSTVGLIRRFFDVYGTPNFFSVESMCFRCRLIGNILTLGKYPTADPANSRCILLWGNNPVNSSPPITDFILESRKKGAKLMVVDPRRTPLAKQADIHVQLRPGTDGALLLGLLNVIISEELYDKAFVNQWTIGFDKLREHVKGYPPAAVERITWVPADAIVRIARTFATTRPACVVQGTNPLDQQTTGLHNSRAIAILQAITGNIDVSGGAISISRIHSNPIRLPQLMQGMPLGIDKYPLFYEVFGRQFGEGQAMLLPDAILKGEPYPIRAMVISGSNPALTWPDSHKVQQALSALDFLVVMDPFMSETAKLAHIVLPAASFLERTELCDYYALNGIPWVMLRKKAIEVEECWTDLKFWFELAHRMGYGEHFPWKDEEEVTDYILKPSGLTVKHLQEHASGIPYGQIKIKEYEQRGFRTPSGKVELYSETLEKLGHEPMPVYKEPLESPISTPELARKYPLILSTGARTLQNTHSQLRNVSQLRKGAPEPRVEINPVTAAKYHIGNGETVVVETRKGAIELKAEATTDIPLGVVCIPHGWAQANVNLLTDETAADPIIGYPQLKGLLCRISRKD